MNLSKFKNPPIIKIFLSLFSKAISISIDIFKKFSSTLIKLIKKSCKKFYYGFNKKETSLLKFFIFFHEIKK